MTGKHHHVGVVTTFAIAAMICASGCQSVNDDRSSGRIDSPITISMIKEATNTSRSIDGDIRRDIAVMRDEMLTVSFNFLDLADKAGEVSTRLENMHLANIDSPETADYLNRIRTAVERIRARAVIVGNLYSANDHFQATLLGQDQDATIAAAEDVMAWAKKAAAHPDLFADGELVFINATGIEAERVRVFMVLNKRLTIYFNIHQHARTAEESIQACNEAAEAIKSMILDRRDLFNHDLRKKFSQERGLFLEEAERAKRDFQAIKQQVDIRIEESRRDFVNRMAAEDLRVAKNYFDREDRKFWFNFWNIRENGDNLIRAILHADRVERSQAAYIFRDQASVIGAKSREKLWSKEKRRLARRPRLPAYENLERWPDMDANHIANKIWLENRKYDKEEQLIRNIEGDGSKSFPVISCRGR